MFCQPDTADAFAGKKLESDWAVTFFFHYEPAMYIKAIPDGETWQAVAAALNHVAWQSGPSFIYNLHNQKYRTGQVSIQKNQDLSIHT